MPITTSIENFVVASVTGTPQLVGEEDGSLNLKHCSEVLPHSAAGSYHRSQTTTMGSVATPIGGADNSATLYTWSGVSAGVVCLLVGTCWCFIWRRRRNLAQQRVWAQIVQSNHKTIASIGERPKIWTSWLDVDAVSEDRSEVDNWMTAEAESMVSW